MFFCSCALNHETQASKYVWYCTSPLMYFNSTVCFKKNRINAGRKSGTLSRAMPLSLNQDAMIWFALGDLKPRSRKFHHRLSFSLFEGNLQKRKISHCSLSVDRIVLYMFVRSSRSSSSMHLVFNGG